MIFGSRGNALNKREERRLKWKQRKRETKASRGYELLLGEKKKDNSELRMW